MSILPSLQIETSLFRTPPVVKFECCLAGPFHEPRIRLSRSVDSIGAFTDACFGISSLPRSLPSPERTNNHVRCVYSLLDITGHLPTCSHAQLCSLISRPGYPPGPVERDPCYGIPCGRWKELPLLPSSSVPLRCPNIHSLASNRSSVILNLLASRCSRPDTRRNMSTIGSHPAYLRPSSKTPAALEVSGKTNRGHIPIRILSVPVLLQV